MSFVSDDMNMKAEQDFGDGLQLVQIMSRLADLKSGGSESRNVLMPLELKFAI